MGSMFGGLTKTAVSDGSGTKYYDNPIQAGQAQQQGASLYTPDLSGQRMEESNPIPVTKGSDLTISQPNFNDVRDKPEAQTTKGKALGFVLSLAQGAGVGAGQDSFGGGFGAETKHLQNEEDRKIRNNALAQESALRQQQIQQAPQLFNLAIQGKRSDLERNAAQTDYLKAGATRRLRTKGDDLQDKIDAAIAAGLEPGTPEYNQAVYNNTLQPRIPNGEGGLAFVAAGDTAQAAQANKALGILEHKQKSVKGAPSGSGGNHVRGQATVAASQFLQKHSGDAEAAIADFQAQLPAAIAKNPAVQDAAPYIIQEIKKAGKKKSSKPTLQFANTGK